MTLGPWDYHRRRQNCDQHVVLIRHKGSAVMRAAVDNPSASWKRSFQDWNLNTRLTPGVNLVCDSKSWKLQEQEADVYCNDPGGHYSTSLLHLPRSSIFHDIEMSMED